MEFGYPSGRNSERTDVHVAALPCAALPSSSSGSQPLRETGCEGVARRAAIVLGVSEPLAIRHRLIALVVLKRKPQIERSHLTGCDPV